MTLRRRYHCHARHQQRYHTQSPGGWDGWCRQWDLWGNWRVAGLLGPDTSDGDPVPHEKGVSDLFGLLWDYWWCYRPYRLSALHVHYAGLTWRHLHFLSAVNMRRSRHAGWSKWLRHAGTLILWHSTDTGSTGLLWSACAPQQSMNTSSLRNMLFRLMNGPFWNRSNWFCRWVIQI